MDIALSLTKRRIENKSMLKQFNHISPKMKNLLNKNFKLKKMSLIRSTERTVKNILMIMMLSTMKSILILLNTAKLSLKMVVVTVVVAMVVAVVVVVVVIVVGIVMVIKMKNIFKETTKNNIMKRKTWKLKTIKQRSKRMATKIRAIKSSEKSKDHLSATMTMDKRKQQKATLHQN